MAIRRAKDVNKVLSALYGFDFNDLAPDEIIFMILFEELGSAKPQSATLTYKTYDGSEVITTETVYDGGDGTITNQTARPSTAQYDYTPDGWSLTPNGAKDANALVAVTEDRTVYAAYTSTVRTYTATFVKASEDGGGTLYTQNNIPYGTTPTYGGATPTTSRGSATDYPFEGWKPALSGITGNTTYTAKFGSPVEVAEITDDWDTIIANIDNGTYSTKYKIGNYKPLDLGTEGTINMQIVAIDGDELASGGYAPLTFLGMELLNTGHKMYETGYGEDGWMYSDLRTYLKGTIKPLISANISSRINTVKKYSSLYSDGRVIVNGQISYDDVWIPSIHEIQYTNTRAEDTGVTYPKLYYSESPSYIKTKADGTSFDPNRWWLRSKMNSKGFRYVSGSDRPQMANGICLGFCLGLEQETITDDWETILANQNYATDYSIGDTKMIDLGTEGKHLMEIVAFDTDDRADGNGKAGITWISKDCLATGHAFNTSQKTVDGVTSWGEGGWEYSDLRAYLNDTIMPLIPQTVKTAIVQVKKKHSSIANATQVSQTTQDYVWIPSCRELNVDYYVRYIELEGVIYSKFASDADRIKAFNSDYLNQYITRSVNNARKSFMTKIKASGTYDSASVGDRYGIALGFCTN